MYSNNGYSERKGAYAAHNARTTKQALRDLRRKQYRSVCGPNRAPIGLAGFYIACAVFVFVIFATTGSI